MASASTPSQQSAAHAAPSAVHCCRRRSWLISAFLLVFFFSAHLSEDIRLNSLHMVELLSSRQTASVPSAPASAAPSPKPSDALQWVPSENISAILNATTRHVAGGCPPPPALCRLEHVFTHVFIIGMPRAVSRARRAAAQVRALGCPFTLIAAVDAVELWARNPTMRSIENGNGGRGSTALALTHRHVLGFLSVALADGEHALVLEDDVTFSSDFVERFDAIARSFEARAAEAGAEPWRFFFLGSNVWRSECSQRGDVVDGQSIFIAPGIASVDLMKKCVQHLYGSVAFAVDKKGAETIQESLRTCDCPIDTGPYATVHERFPRGSFIAWPLIASMSPYTSYVVGNGQAFFSVEEWAAWNWLSEDRFDFRGDGYVAGATTVRMRSCANVTREEGVDFVGYNVRWLDRPRNEDECCDACRRDFIYCRAWTFTQNETSGTRRCELKSAAAGRTPAAQDPAVRYVSADIGPDWGRYGGDVTQRL